MECDSNKVQHTPDIDVLEVRGICKKFGSVQALLNVDFSLEKGETHVLIGENGAGKTTLMNIVYGLYQADQGDIFVNGIQKSISCPNDAIKLGIGMVHQHFMLVHNLTVTENIILGKEPVNYGRIDRKKARGQVVELAIQYGFNIDPDAKIEDLTVSQQQKVEILKLLYRGANILILDEPTAVLTPNEILELATILRNLNNEGKSVILITHKLKEVISMSDRLTVLRHGKVTGIMETNEACLDKIVELMIGKKMKLELNVERHNSQKQILRINNLVVLGSHKLPVIHGLNLTINSGEILGLAGVDGNGQSELVEAIMGLKKIDSGEIVLNNLNITNLNSKEIINNGAACVPEDRHERGLILSMPLYENMLLGSYDEMPFSKGIWINKQYTMDYTRNLVSTFDIRTPNIYTEAMWLSGGNQQKFVVARELSRKHKLLIVAQPTRGVDIGAKQFIHQRIIADRDQGKAVFLVSTELDEILELSDRIAVIYKGKIIGTYMNDGIDERELGLMMTGSKGSIDNEKNCI